MADDSSDDELSQAEKTIYERRKELGFPKMTDVEMMKQSSEEKLLMAVGGIVFDASAWGDEHPGGKLVLQRNSGVDVTDMFNRIGHSDSAREKLAKMFVADLQETEEGRVMMAQRQTQKPPPEPPKVSAKKLL